MILVNAVTKSEVDGCKEAIDLIRNGYYILFSWGYENGIIYKLRHQRNGRILTVNIQQSYYEIKEKNTVLKRVEYND